MDSRIPAFVLYASFPPGRFLAPSHALAAQTKIWNWSWTQNVKPCDCDPTQEQDSSTRTTQAD